MSKSIKLADGWTKSSYSGHAGACVIARANGGAVEFGDSKFGRVYDGPTPVLRADAALFSSIKSMRLTAR